MRTHDKIEILLKRARRERRERYALAALAAVESANYGGEEALTPSEVAIRAVSIADALITELDLVAESEGDLK